MARDDHPRGIISWASYIVTQAAQKVIEKVLAPYPPSPQHNIKGPKIAVVGAGITGVTAAAHCIGHGFDVQIFEAGDEKSLGGIWSMSTPFWARVNSTSSLQIHSAMYRFHPSVNWSRGYPDRDEILSQLRKVWDEYDLSPRTRFSTPVKKVYQDEQGRWIINDPSNGRFDGLIVAVGTCGKNKMPHIPGMERFKGEIRHSSQLDDVDAKDRSVAIIGGGASAVEALEFAVKSGTRKIYVLSRTDKWIIPRNAFADVALSWNILGQETVFSWIPEMLLRRFFYRDLKDIAPQPGDKGLFEDTPMVNSDVLKRLRSGQAEWVRCDIEEIVPEGVAVNRRAKGVPKGGPGKHDVIDVDLIVMATGYARPSLAFLPEDCFAEPYAPPNWYLQTFPPQHPSISAINCTYLSAIGSVGNWHIGIYTRILLMFLLDPLTRPSPFWMRKWIDMTRSLKRASPTPAFDFFTYLELLWWFFFCIAINPLRWKWALFVFTGIGGHLPERTAEKEDVLRHRLGYGGKEWKRDEGNSL